MLLGFLPTLHFLALFHLLVVLVRENLFRGSGGSSSFFGLFGLLFLRKQVIEGEAQKSDNDDKGHPEEKTLELIDEVDVIKLGQ